MDRRDLLKVSPLAVASAVGYVAGAEVSRVADAKVLFDVRSYGAAGDGMVKWPRASRARSRFLAALRMTTGKKRQEKKADPCGMTARRASGSATAKGKAPAGAGALVVAL